MKMVMVKRLLVIPNYRYEHFFEVMVNVNHVHVAYLVFITESIDICRYQEDTS